MLLAVEFLRFVHMRGYFAEVIHYWFAERGSGFLEARLGDILVVLHVGSYGNEKGWLYARLHAAEKSNHVADNAGWLPASVTRTTVKKAVPVALESGYLAPLSIGDIVEVLYIGIKPDEEGWIYARHTVCGSGWLLCRNSAGWFPGTFL